MRPPRTVLATAAVAVLLVGCEIPTEAPILEQRWIIPLNETTLGVNELLPAGIVVSGGNFDVSIDPVTMSEDLGTLCASCVVLNGVTTTLPPFNGTFNSTSTLPSDVVSATIVSGSVEISIQNGLSFDPLENGGTLTITVTDGVGGAQLGQVVVSGEPLAPGSTTIKTMAIAAANVGSTLDISAAMNAPGGQTVTINTSERATITATTTSLLVSSATVNVGSRSVNIQDVALDVAALDSVFTDRIVEGTIILDVVNPFGISVSGTVNIGPTSKSFSLGAGATSSVSISYTGAELRSFLGQSGVTFSGSGTATGGQVTVSPGQEMTIKATLDLTIEVG
jgi:hypothetical protein